MNIVRIMLPILSLFFITHIFITHITMCTDSYTPNQALLLYIIEERSLHIEYYPFDELNKTIQYLPHELREQHSCCTIVFDENITSLQLAIDQYNTAHILTNSVDNDEKQIYILNWLELFKERSEKITTHKIICKVTRHTRLGEKIYAQEDPQELKNTCNESTERECLIHIYTTQDQEENNCISLCCCLASDNFLPRIHGLLLTGNIFSTVPCLGTIEQKRALESHILIKESQENIFTNSTLLFDNIEIPSTIEIETAPIQIDPGQPSSPVDIPANDPGYDGDDEKEYTTNTHVNSSSSVITHTMSQVYSYIYNLITGIF